MEKVQTQPDTGHTQGGKTYLSETQTMLPLTIGGVCVFLCLAASSLTLILSLFSLHFIMCKSEVMAQEVGKQEVTTETELKPLCLHRQ